MKETKVYMELPNGANEETCDECPYVELGEVQHYFINNEIVSCRDCVCKLDKSCGFRHGEKNCPLIDIKTHDRELVKEVLKRVKDVAFNSKVICDKEGLPCFGEMRQIYGIYDYELDQIQKEFEK